MSGSISSTVKRMHPVYKLLLCLCASLLGFIAVYFTNIDTLSRIMVCWNLFSLTMLILDWHIFLTTKPPQIHEFANKEDEGRLAIFTIVLIATFASLLAVALLLITETGTGSGKVLHITVALTGMMLSWTLVHTLFAIHYAHLYYGDDEENPDSPLGGLQFPGKGQPDFLDFAYFSFVLGMTFQVSDVQVTSKSMRHIALLHGLLSFGYNTVIVALSINTIAGLSGR